MLKLKTLVAAAVIAGGFSLCQTAMAADAQAIMAATAGQSGMPSLAPIIERVSPAVVTINVEGSKEMRGSYGADPFQFFFGDPFGNPFGGPGMGAPGMTNRPFKALGSGVIVDAEKGYVVTNNHVISDAKKIKVTLSDGREFEAKLIGADPQTDVALIQIKAEKLQAVEYADSDKLRVGDFAIAVGNPFGLGQTVTYGIISALGRAVDNGDQLENYIQTDAPINQGNSGGSLIDLNGHLVGINTAIVAPNGGNVGIGFAIPSNMIKEISEQLIKYGEVRRGYLGIIGGELTADLADKFGVAQNKGAFVSQVMKDSAADAAGIKAGDVIISIDGKPINSFSQLRAKIATRGEGGTITLGIVRDGKEISVKVTLQKAEPKQVKTENKAMNELFEGVKLATADGKIPGVEIVEIDPRSQAARRGLQKGDLIVGVNRAKIENVDDLNKVLSKAEGAQAINVIRDGMNMYIIMR